MSARSRLEALLRGEQAQPAFIPMVEPLAPRLASCSHGEMTANAALWASGVQQAAKLLGADAVGIGFDRAFAIASCRESMDQPEARGPMAVLLDAAERLFTTQRANLGCIIALCGPATLAAALAPERTEKEALALVKAPMTRLVEAACKHRPDLVVFLETESVFTAPPSPDLRRAYGTYRKIAGYFGIASGLLVDGACDGAEALDCDVLVLDRADQSPPESWRAVVASLAQQPDAAKATTERLLAARKPGGTAIAFGIEGISDTASLETLRTIQSTIAALRA